MSTAVTLLLAAMLLVPTAQNVWADEPAITPDSPRLLDQPLTSQASKDSIKTLLAQPPFKNKETVTRYRFGEDEPARQNQNDGKTPDWLKALVSLFDSQRFGFLANLIEVLLGRRDRGRRLADLALPRLVAGVRQPSTTDKPPGCACRAATRFRPGVESRNPARRHCSQRRKSLAGQPARRPRVAVSRSAQPPAA
jgi:hypothetical protein